MNHQEDLAPLSLIGLRSWCWPGEWPPKRVTWWHISFLRSLNLVGGWATPLKNMTSSIGMMTFPIYGKIKLMFQTTNQIQPAELLMSTHQRDHKMCPTRFTWPIKPNMSMERRMCRWQLSVNASAISLTRFFKCWLHETQFQVYDMAIHGYCNLINNTCSPRANKTTQIVQKIEVYTLHWDRPMATRLVQKTTRNGPNMSKQCDGTSPLLTNDITINQYKSSISGQLSIAILNLLR